MNAGGGMPPTAVVVLNWNRPDLTLACLESLLPATRGRPVTLVVCDNASGDDSLERLAAWGRRHFGGRPRTPAEARFLLLRTPRNLGFAGGNNAALRWVLEGDYEFVWLLNSDTRVCPDTLDRLVECARRHPRAGCIGATLLEADRPDIAQCAGGCRFNPWLTTFRQAWQGRAWGEVSELPEPVLDYVAGASLFLPTEALRRVGLLNEAFFLYYEELDLACRLRDAGYRLAWCRRARVCHHGGASLPADAFRHYHENLSTLQYLWQHHRLIFPFAAVFRFLAKCLWLPLGGRTGLLPSLLAAYRDFRPGGFRAEAEPAAVILTAGQGTCHERAKAPQ